MASIVGAFVMSHVPLILAAPHAPERAVADEVFNSFKLITHRLRELEVDTVVIIGADHYGLFGPHCVPQCLIGIGGVDGPSENWLGIEREEVLTNQPLAKHILKQGYADGIDWAFATSLTADHSVMLPYHLTVRQIEGVKTIPVYLNQVVQPIISSRRVCAIGQSIRRGVESWSGSERVAIFGTGGVSHWVGTPEMGRINEAFDRHILDLVQAGDVAGLAALSDQQILDEGGNGAMEVRNWLCAMAAVPGSHPHIVSYQPVPQWVTGVAFAELRLAA
jgi:protocatechuate 4,5-dioxygenase beta chain